MILVKHGLQARLISPVSTINDAFNICAVAVGAGSLQTLIITVYRAPWALTADNECLSTELDNLLLRHSKSIIVGDFNIPDQQSTCGRHIINHIELEHSLHQLSILPTRGTAVLDLVLVSSNFVTSTVANLPPIAGSDHYAQLITIPELLSSAARERTYRFVDYQQLALTLRNVNWSLFFAGCVNVDEYANRFTEFILSATAASSCFKPALKRQRLPKHVVRLLQLKRRMWTEGRRSGNFSLYEAAKRNTRAAVRQHNRNLEYRLTFSRNRKAFFSHIYKKLGRVSHDISVDVNGTQASDSVAAEAFIGEFSNNFSKATDALSAASVVSIDDVQQSQLVLNCTEADVMAALIACPIADSSPDGLSYRLLKVVAGCIARPLNIIFQQSLFTGIFPRVWKTAVVLPLYKGRGNRSDISSYRPISLCSCLGKVFERVVYVQLQSYLSSHGLMHRSQHGFSAGRSTVTNVLTADNHIADAISAGHPYDILTFDFKKAFDRAPHRSVITCLSNLGVAGSSLRWFASFLIEREQRVKIGNSYSRVSAVPSGVVQGSVLGPALFTVLLDSLLRRLRLPAVAFADDVKYVADVAVHSQREVQAEIDTLADWSAEHDMPLSIEKCAVLHCGNGQQNFNYKIGDVFIPVVNSLVDLGLQRSSSCGYEGHCDMVASKASKLAGAIRRSFQLRVPQLLWPAFQAYVVPILMYGASAWNPSLQCDIDRIERVQQRFTKSIPELHELSYSERLARLSALSLQSRRLYADLVLTYKALHGLLSCPSADLGLNLMVSTTRGSGLSLRQRLQVSKAASALFPFRVPSIWNKLPRTIIASANLTQFKHNVLNYLHSV
jgi:Reverse transcriptase (RNA-dependent DNA polymerase)/Endonuclease-reverse transcriptase